MKQKVTAAIEKFNFHGDDLDVVIAGGEHYVSLPRLCEALHLDVKTQAEKIKSYEWSTWGIFPLVAADGKTRDAVCLSIRCVAGWLFTINAGKVVERARPKLAVYQRECADVLADHFLGKRERTGSVDLAPIMQAFATLASLVKAQNDRLDALESQARTGHVMAAERSNAIKQRVRSCALDLSKFGVEKMRAASLRIHKRIKDRVGWSGVRCRLDNMPARHEADVLRELEIIENETVGAVTAARQLRFPALAVVGNRNAKRSAS